MSRMRRDVVGLLVVLAAAGACTSPRTSSNTDAPREVAAAMPAPTQTDTSPEHIKTAEVEGVIIPGSKAASFIGKYSAGEFSGTWTPSRSEVLELEKRIQAYLKQTAPNMSESGWSDLATYRRQYAGILQQGRRVIYANFFCYSFDMDWTTERVEIDDGGECYFQVLYDPGSATFSRLQINGEA